MDEDYKQKTVKPKLQSLFTSLKSGDVSALKLWPYTIGIGCGIAKPLVTDIKFIDTPLVSLYGTGGYGDRATSTSTYGVDDYNAFFSANASYIIEQLVDAANEICPFDVENVFSIVMGVWRTRQACVFPACTPTSVEHGDPIKQVFQSFTNVDVHNPEIFTLKENRNLAIGVNAVHSIILDSVKKDFGPRQ